MDTDTLFEEAQEIRSMKTCVDVWSKRYCLEEELLQRISEALQEGPTGLAFGMTLVSSTPLNVNILRLPFCGRLVPSPASSTGPFAKASCIE